MKCTQVAEESTKSSHHFLAAFNNFHNFICKINQVQLFHQYKNTAYFYSYHFAYSFSIYVCALSFHICFPAHPSWPWCCRITHANLASTSGSELFEEIDFSPPHVMPESLPCLQMCGDHNHGFLRLCNTQRHMKTLFSKFPSFITDHKITE